MHKSLAMNKHLHFFSALFLLGLSQVISQTNSLSLNDSLIGFNEKAWINAAPYNGITAEEMPFYIEAHRREFIKQKYNIRSIEPKVDYAMLSKTALAACVNEDFEEANLTSPVPGTINITAINAINGWSAYGSSNSAGGTNGNCTNTYSYTNPNAIQLIAPGPGGLTDGIIGGGYKIHSVFGDSLNPLATSLYGYNCYGDWFAKINNQVAGSSVNRLTKTINVTPSNVYFNFAVLVVMEGGHCCCDGGSISIIFKDCLGNTLATAQQYSIAAPAAAGCTPTGTCATSNSLTIFTSTVNPNWKYSKWTNSSIDLSLWMGQCINVEFTAFDCTYAGHAGYAYIDAQCAPTVVNGINLIAIHNAYKLYPNPNSGSFNIEISKAITSGEIELRNVLGQTVFKQTVKQGNNSIKTENLAKGIYNYSIYNNKEVVSVGKVVID